VAAKLLGVTFCHNLKFEEQVTILIQNVTDEVICSNVLRVKAIQLKSLILYFVLDYTTHFICTTGMGRVFDCRSNWQDRCLFA